MTRLLPGPAALACLAFVVFAAAGCTATGAATDPAPSASAAGGTASPVSSSAAASR